MTTALHDDFCTDAFLDWLLIQIDGQVDWRWRKAELYPEDARNERSALALQELAAHLRQHATDYSLQAQWLATKFYAFLDDDGESEFEQVIRDRIARYGFHRREDITQFVTNLMNLARNLAA
jgi:hypothetical protein